MLEYLLNYGSTIKDDVNTDYDLDITDKTILQEQINKVRHSYNKLIKLLESIQGEAVSSKQELAKLVNSYSIDYSNRNERVKAISEDENIIDLKSKVEALEGSIKIVNEQINLIKIDLRILGNSMYER
jgi:hypothetical protein